MSPTKSLLYCKRYLCEDVKWRILQRDYLWKTPMYQTPHCDFNGTAYTLKLSVCLQWTEDPSRKVTERWDKVKICRDIGIYFPEYYVDKQNFKALNLIQARNF